MQPFLTMYWELLIDKMEETKKFVTISSYIELTEEIRRASNVNFVFDINDYLSSPSFPDTIKFNKGRFNTKVRAFE